MPLGTLFNLFVGGIGETREVQLVGGGIHIPVEGLGAVTEVIQRILNRIYLYHEGVIGILFILLGALFLIFRQTRRCGLFLLLALLVGLLICNITLKPLIARIRPYDLKQGIDLLIEAPTDFSFPSGHTNASFVFATVIFCTNKKWGVGAFILAALIAFSRLYLYVHYPTDVLAGIVCGIFAGWITVFLLRKLLTRFPRLESFFPQEGS